MEIECMGDGHLHSHVSNSGLSYNRENLEKNEFTVQEKLYNVSP